MIRTNVMLTPNQHTTLKQMAASMHRTLGELVRDAIDSTFTVDIVERRHQVAVAAYREGFISIGKLAQSLGVDPLTARSYLKERGIQQLVQGTDELIADATNA
jgi:predicted HTH domain antitoxin